MKNFKTLSNLIENSIVPQKTYEKITTDLKFKKDKIVNKLNLVSRDEFEILKKLYKSKIN